MQYFQILPRWLVFSYPEDTCSTFGFCKISKLNLRDVDKKERLKPQEEKTEEDRSKVDDLRGSPMSVGNLEELIDENHAIVSSSVGPEYYVGILSFVDKDQLEPGCAILMHNKVLSVVGLLQDEVDSMVSVMKVEKAPLESYADIGGLDAQIQEIKEAVELPLTHPELSEKVKEMSVKPSFNWPGNLLVACYQLCESYNLTHHQSRYDLEEEMCNAQREAVEAAHQKCIQMPRIIHLRKAAAIGSNGERSGDHMDIPNPT
ncbi:unnamed protein product [Camellia sinensis]